MTGLKEAGDVTITTERVKQAGGATWLKKAGEMTWLRKAGEVTWLRKAGEVTWLRKAGEVTWLRKAGAMSWPRTFRQKASFRKPAGSTVSSWGWQHALHQANWQLHDHKFIHYLESTKYINVSSLLHWYRTREALCCLGKNSETQDALPCTDLAFRCIRSQSHTHTHTHTHTHMLTHTHNHTHTHTHTCSHTHTITHTHTHICSHTHTHTHTCSYTHTQPPPPHTHTHTHLQQPTHI